MRSVLTLLTLLVLLAACNDPRVPPISRSDALRDTTVRQVRVVKVWDQVSDRMEADGDPHISHYIEVDVVGGQDDGKKLTLPFDAWNAGIQPPEVGTVLTMCAADWVKPNPKGKTGRQFGDW
jgi:hypothetical protein